MTPVQTAQHGYLLVAVAMLLAVIAALALMANPASIVSSMRIAGETDKLKLGYVVRAGMEHALWQANNANCGPYTEIPVTPFGSHTYNAQFTPAAGSPISVTATGTLASGIGRTLTLRNSPVYQPVTTTMATLSAGSGKDAYLDETESGWNYGASSLLRVRGGTASRHVLLRFDIEPLPARSRLVSVTLELHTTSVIGAGPISVHELNQGWSEGSGDADASGGVTWDDRDGGEPWVTAGGDYDPEPSGATQVAGPTGWHGWDITSLYRDWASGASINNGLVLVPQDASPDVAFASSEHADASLHPRLVQKFACECGVGGSSGSLVLQPGSSGKDTQIHENPGQVNFGSDPQLMIDAEANKPVRSLLQFDLSALPAGVAVTSATLSLFSPGNTGGDNIVEAHRITRAWEEGNGAAASGATWQTYDGVNSWTTDGGDYATGIAGTFSTAGTGWKQLNITGLVSQWVNGAEANYGVALLSPPSPGNNPKTYDSSDSPNIAARPRLTIDYSCPCGIDCDAGAAGGGVYCDADFEANAKRFEFEWGGDTGNIIGIDFLPEGTLVDGITIPAGGGWIMSDDNKNKFFVVDQAGAALTDFSVAIDNVRGIAFVASGLWADHLAVVSDSHEAVYFTDLDGNVAGSFSTVGINEHPFGLSFIGVTESHIYDDHLAISSEKDSGGDNVGAVYIVDQAGVFKTSIDVDSVAPKPRGVAHLAGEDKLMVGDQDGLISIVGFDGAVANQYDGMTWGYAKLQGVTLHPSTCDHVVIDKNHKSVGGFNIGDATAAGATRLLMVVADPASLAAEEQAKKSQFEFWGYVIELIDDEASNSHFDTAVAATDVVFVGETISANNLDDKLADAYIGIVLEEPNLSDEFGLSSTVGWSTGSALEIDDNSQYITEPFPLGPLSVLDTDLDLASLSGTIAPDLYLLGSGAPGPMLVALEANRTGFDALPAAGRRVQLPWGGSNFDPGNLTPDGKTILRRSLDWAERPPPRCDADYAARSLVTQFPWMAGTGDLQGIDYVREGLQINATTVPAGGGWIMSDRNEDRLFLTSLDGTALTDFAIIPDDTQGVAMIDFGDWMHHIAVVDKSVDRVYLLDLDGSIVWSFKTAAFNQNPLGIAFVGETASGTYDGHLVLSSDKNVSGGGTATLSVVDQFGNLSHTIDVDSFAPKPQGVTHLTGYDKLMISDRNGLVSVIDFDGNLLHQYSGLNFGLTELTDITVNPMTCEHVMIDKDFQNIGVVDANPGSGSGSGQRHVEMHALWNAVSADTWETKSLGIYGVPANAVVEVAIVNEDGGKELWGGVRAAGSTLQRRLRLHEAGGGGTDSITMHVQADASGRIQHYSDDPNKLKFVLLGYWTESAYIEQWQPFKAGGDGGWRPHSLNSYGVNAGEVAEILLVNTDGFAERQAGVRSEGSLLNRWVDLHEARDGGTEGVTMFAVAGADASATVELHAELDASIDFYLLGRWSTPPGTYTETFNDLGTASASDLWQDTDLDPYGVAPNAIVQIAAVNRQIDAEAFLGARATGALLDRRLEVHQSENGGADFATLHVNADNDSVIQWYDEEIADDHRFYLLGWWSSP